MLEEIPVLVSGAYIGSAEEQAVQRDIQVRDASHPLAQGFAPDEVISFVAAPSGTEYEMDVLSDLDDGDTDVVFVRGPESEGAACPLWPPFPTQPVTRKSSLPAFPSTSCPRRPSRGLC
jgi:hypothetical protein